MKLHLLPLLALVLIPQFSSAQTIRSVSFTGEVSSVSGETGPFGMNPSIGDPITATFTYDTEVDGIPRSGGFRYPQLTTTYSIWIDGHTVTPFDLNWQVLINSSGPPNQTFDVVYFEHNSNGPGHIAVDGVEQTSGIFQFCLFDDVAPPLGSDAFPDMFPGLSQWDRPTAFIRDNNTGAQINMALIGMTQSCPTNYPGTGEDLFLGTGVNRFATFGPCSDVKTAMAHDFLSLWLVSVGGTFDADPPILVAQPFSTGGPPPVGVLPGLHVDSQMIVLAFGAVMTPVGWSTVIGPPGSFYNIQIPPGLEGMSIILQGGTLSSNAANGFLALTDAHELRIVLPGG